MGIFAGMWTPFQDWVREEQHPVHPALRLRQALRQRAAARERQTLPPAHRMGHRTPRHGTPGSTIAPSFRYEGSSTLKAFRPVAEGHRHSDVPSRVTSTRPPGQCCATTWEACPRPKRLLATLFDQDHRVLVQLRKGYPCPVDGQVRVSDQNFRRRRRLLHVKGDVMDRDDLGDAAKDLSGRWDFSGARRSREQGVVSVVQEVDKVAALL